MTEYATTPSAVEEWNAQRDRTATWVHSSFSPELCLPPSRTPSTGSDFGRRSLWDGSGWEPPSDCESSVSIPPTMMLQYSDHRKVLISPTQSETSGRKASERGRERTGTGDGDRTERALSHRGHSVTGSQQQQQSNVEPVQMTGNVPAAIPSHSSSARLAQAAAAPLPDSHSSSSSRKLNGSESPVKLRFRARSPSPPASNAQIAPASATHVSQSHSRTHPASHESRSHHSQTHSQAEENAQSRAPSQAAALPPFSHSNSLSSSHSLSTVPEPIIIHPPAPSASQQSHSTQSSSNSSIYPRSYVPSHYSQRTVQAATHVPLPPPSTASASLSYYSQSQVKVEPEHIPSHHSVSDRPFSQQALMQNYYAPQAPPSGSHRSLSASAQHNAGGSPLYSSAPLAHSQSHPPAAHAHSPSQSHSQTGRASMMSYGSQAGLGGGYVVVNQVNLPEQAANQGSVGDKSIDSQRHRRSLFNVFGSRGSKSRLLPQAEFEKTAQVLPPPVPESPESHYSNHSHRSHRSDPYLSPVSPTSAPQHIPAPNENTRRYNPALGPNPPSIVYAPARHGRATRYSPPRIMYMPGTSPHRRELARSRSPAGSVRRAATFASPGAGSLSGERWDREDSVVRSPRHETGWGADVRKEVPRQMMGPQESHAHRNMHEDANVYAANVTVGPPMPYGPPHPDIEGNMAGVGTLRSQTRSRSRARGIAFSASAPPPAGPPTASMAIPPSVTMSKRDAGITPYPTPPGSASSHHASPVSQVSDSAPPIPISVVPPSIRSAHTPPAEDTSSGGLMSRFHDLRSLNTATTPAPPSTPGSTSTGRGRARERDKKSIDLEKIKEARKHRKERRAHSVDSEVSHSSASTYYVIPTPGQKVRIIRTDGRTVTATTTASQFQSELPEQEQHGGGWLKKALKPRFLHLKTASAELKPAPVPGRTNSGSSSGSKKSGRKLVRRGSTSSAALLSRQASVNAP